MAIRILVVAEAEADWEMVSRLIDRKTLHHAPQWLKDDPDNLDGLRIWSGLTPDFKFATYSDIKKVSLGKYNRGLRSPGPLGFSKTEPTGYEWEAIRKTLIRAYLGLEPIPDVIVFSRDMDRQLKDRSGSIQAALESEIELPFKVVLALANAKREAWILSGFVAKNAVEEQRLEKLRSELKFDPCEQAERLDAMAHGAVKDAKRVLEILTGGDHEREDECLNQAWDILRRRGKGTGLTDFLDQVKANVVQRITGESP